MQNRDCQGHGGKQTPTTKYLPSMVNSIMTVYFNFLTHDFLSLVADRRYNQDSKVRMICQWLGFPFAINFPNQTTNLTSLPTITASLLSRTVIYLDHMPSSMMKFLHVRTWGLDCRPRWKSNLQVSHSKPVFHHTVQSPLTSYHRRTWTTCSKCLVLAEQGTIFLPSMQWRSMPFFCAHS